MFMRYVVSNSANSYLYIMYLCTMLRDGVELHKFLLFTITSSVIERVGMVRFVFRCYVLWIVAAWNNAQSLKEDGTKIRGVKGSLRRILLR